MFSYEKSDMYIYFYRLDHWKDNISRKLENLFLSVNNSWLTVQGATEIMDAREVSWTTLSNTSKPTKETTQRRATHMKLR